MISSGMNERILLHTPDITLKGHNQNEFKNQLVSNIRKRLNYFNHDWHVVAGLGRINIRVPDDSKNADEVARTMQQVPGVSSISRSVFLPMGGLVHNSHFEWSHLEDVLIRMSNESYRENSSFSVQVNRTYKQIPVRSVDIASRLGESILTNTKWEKVNLKKPDQKFFIDIYPDGFYIYTKKLRGVGGLPVGTAGKVLGLLSGGIDSPVAIHQMAKRGCYVDMLHFSTMHMDANAVDNSVIGKLARRLSLYTQRSRLYVMPYTYFDLCLRGKHSGYELVMFRRFMMRVAETLASKRHSLALVIGDSLGQVASQTLENIATSSAGLRLPVFRPLIGTNKDEIIAIARSIGTFDISIEPYKDCCALVGHGPKTRTSDEKASYIESRLFPDYEAMMKKTLEDTTTLDYGFGEVVQ